MTASPPSRSPAPTETAVVVPVAAAEEVVGELRRELDRSAPWGVPAHVTVLYPFVAPVLLDDHVVTRVRAAVATVGAFDCSFARCGWFDEDVLWLDPEPAAPFRALTAAVWAEFPECPPYDGAHPDVVPHLTVGEAAVGSVEQLRAAEAAVNGRLPLPTRIDRAVLMAGTAADDSWHTVCVLPLGAPEG